MIFGWLLDGPYTSKESALETASKFTYWSWMLHINLFKARTKMYNQQTYLGNQWTKMIITSCPACFCSQIFCPTRSLPLNKLGHHMAILSAEWASHNPSSLAFILWCCCWTWSVNVTATIRTNKGIAAVINGEIRMCTYEFHMCERLATFSTTGLAVDPWQGACSCHGCTTGTTAHGCHGHGPHGHGHGYGTSMRIARHIGRAGKGQWYWSHTIADGLEFPEISNSWGAKNSSLTSWTCHPEAKYIPKMRKTCWK